MGTVEDGRDVVYYSGIVSTGSGGNTFGYNLHWDKTGDVGTVCEAATNIQGMHKGYGLGGGRIKERRIVVPRGARDTA